jgi:hypothetical protein
VKERTYYSVRSGKHPTGGRLDLAGVKSLFVSAFCEFQTTGHFQQYLGFVCVDAGDIAGSVGSDVEGYFFRKLKKRGLWPIAERVEAYSEDDLFDVIELLHDCASKGVDGRFHSWGECGWHYETFDKSLGESEFRSVINEILERRADECKGSMRRRSPTSVRRTARRSLCVRGRLDR